MTGGGGPRGVRRRGAVPLAAMVATAVAVAVLPAAAASADSGKTPAFRISEDAEPIKGTASSGDGPELKPGSYKDAITSGEKKYYTVHLDARTSDHFSVAAGVPPGSKISPYGDRLELSLQAVDGTSCGDGPVRVNFGTIPTGHPIAGEVVRDMADERCTEPGPYVLSVQREASAPSAPSARGAWPLELSYRQEPRIKGAAPGGGSDRARTGSAAPMPQATGERKQAQGGAGFSDAGAVSSGLWKDRIRPGETRFYRVPLDWGQQLAASVEMGSSRRGGTFPSTLYRAFGATVHGPTWAPLHEQAAEDYRADSAAVRILTPKVLYGNRFELNNRSASTAGWHYLAVTAAPRLSTYFPGSGGAPVTLRLDVRGKARPGPDYDGDAAAAGFGIGDKDHDVADKGLTEAEARTSDGKKTFGYAGIGVGTALIVALVAWLLLARRRSAPSAASAPGGPWPPQGPPPYDGQGGPYPYHRPHN